MGFQVLRLDYADLASVLGELHYAIGQREQRVIASTADVTAGVELRAALSDDYAASADFLTAIHLDPKHLGVAIAPVTT